MFAYILDFVHGFQFDNTDTALRPRFSMQFTRLSEILKFQLH